MPGNGTEIRAETPMKQSSPLAIFLLCFVLFGALGAYLHWGLLPEVRRHNATLESVDRRLAGIEESLALAHFSRDPDKEPIPAVLAHLKFWCDREDQYGSSLIERPILLRNMKLAMNALRRSGAPAFDQLEDAFYKTAGDKQQTQFRKRLLRVMKDLDKDRARELAASVLSTPGTDPEVRIVGGEVLLALDPALAGDKLRNVILQETARGVRHVMPTSNGLHPGLKFRGFPGFFNLINLYLKSRNEAKEDVLLTVLRTEGHSTATLLAALEGLTAKGTKSSITHLKNLYDEPATTEHRNVYVRQRMVRTIVSLEGTKACGWLVEQLTKSGQPAVQRVIKQLLKSKCGVRR